MPTRNACCVRRGRRNQYREWQVGLLIAILALAAAPSAGGQVLGGNVGGVVVDESGGRLPGVTITVTNLSNGRSQTLVTGEEGTYRAVALQPAAYEVTATLTGFAIQKRQVTLAIGADLNIDFKLTISSLEESVTVVGGRTMVEVTKSQLSSVVDSEQVATLPVLSRSFVELAQLLPGTGVNNTQGSAFITTRFGGAALQKNAFTTLIDGGSVDDAIGGGTRVNVSQDLVQEFTVLRNQFDAQYGSALNAVVTAVTKSGTNELRGSGYYFGRDRSLNARNAFARGEKPPFDQQRIGVTFGGPIKLNQTHYFGGYEYNNVDTVNVIALPASNPFATQENGNFPSGASNHLLVTKLDHRFNDKHSLMVRYLYDDRYEIGGASTSDTNVTDQENQNHSIVAEENWILTQNTVNTFRIHAVKQNLSFIPHSDEITIQRPSVTRGSATFAPQHWPRWTLQASETLYLNTPRHSIKIGGDFSLMGTDYDSFVNDQGMFTFQTDAPFDRNNRATYPIAFTIQKPDSYNFGDQALGLYVQDDWRVADRLRLNLGLRYDVDFNLRHNDFYDRLLSDPQYAGIENFVSRDRGNDWNNVQPRLGVTYDVRGDSTLVMRGGFGLYVTRNWPWMQLTSLDQTSAVNVRIEDPQLLQSFPDVNAVLGGRSLEEFLAAGGTRALLLLADDFVLPYSQNTTVGVGWQIGAQTSIDVDYVHDYAAAQLGGTDRNLPPEGRISASNPRPVGNFSRVIMMENYTKTWYDALEVQLRTRMRGLDNMQVSYTLSRSYMDGVDHYNTLRGTQRSPDERGYNSNDTRHNLTVSGAARLPGNFQVAAIAKLISGFPMPVQAGFDMDGDGSITSDRPAGLPTTVGREKVDESLRIINDLRASRGLGPIDGELLKLDPYVSLDARLTKLVPLGGNRNLQLFLEGYNLTNYVNYRAGNRNIIASSFLVRASARDGRQIQWGARYTF